MGTVKEAIQQQVEKASPMSLLLSVLALGILSGTGGTVAMGNVLGVVGAVPEEEFNSVVTELSHTLTDLNNTLRQQQTLLANTRCEVRMLREDGDWRDCWAPDR